MIFLEHIGDNQYWELKSITHPQTHIKDQYCYEYPEYHPHDPVKHRFMPIIA